MKKGKDMERQDEEITAALNSFLSELVAEQDVCDLFYNSDLLDDAHETALGITKQILDFYLDLFKKNLLLVMYEYGEDDLDYQENFNRVLVSISFSLGLDDKAFYALRDHILKGLKKHMKLPDRYYLQLNGLLIPAYVN